MSNPNHWLQTFSTRAFHFDDPVSSDLRIEDIAQSLSRLPRFCGHTNKNLTVAEHSVAVSFIVRDLGGDHLVQLHALLHDAHEAFTGDIPAPFKKYLEDFHNLNLADVQAVIQTNIFGILDIPLLDDIAQVELIHLADMKALKIERDIYMDSNLDWGDVDKIEYDRRWITFYNEKPMKRIPIVRDFMARFKQLWRIVRDAEG